MSYSEDALRLSTIPASSQVRLEDRISFAYLEHARVVQTETGVAAWDESGARRISVPASSIAVIALGPGCSITHAAAASLSACGATVLWTGGGGYRLYAAGVPLTTSSKWTEAQARTWANRAARVEAARFLYGERFGPGEAPAGVRIATLRALEGAAVKAEYKRLARQHGVRFRRDTNSSDPVNTGLNLANSLLYGVAGSVCGALGLSPALGIIHQGDARAFLFDLADVYKLEMSVPIAFECAREADPLMAVRRRMRSQIVKRNLLQRMLALTMTMLTPQLDDSEGDRLIDDGRKSVSAHTNYAGSA